MVKYNLKVGPYSGYPNIEVVIPEEIKFFCNKGTVGHWINLDCEHYTTVVEKEKYQDWIEDFTSKFGIDYEEFGKYAILTIVSLHNDTPVPTVNREDWFKENNIDFNQYTAVLYNCDFQLVYAFKITEFIDVWNVGIILTSLLNHITNNDNYSLNKYRAELNDLHPIFGKGKLVIYDGEEAKQIWNSLVFKVVSNFQYDVNYVDTSFDVNEYQKERLKEIGIHPIE